MIFAVFEPCLQRRRKLPSQGADPAPPVHRARFSRAAINGRCRYAAGAGYGPARARARARGRCSSRRIVTPAHYALPPETAGRAAPTAGLRLCVSGRSDSASRASQARADYQAAGRPANIAARRNDRKACSSAGMSATSRALASSSGSSLVTQFWPDSAGFSLMPIHHLRSPRSAARCGSGSCPAVVTSELTRSVPRDSTATRCDSGRGFAARSRNRTGAGSWPLSASVARRDSLSLGGVPTICEKDIAGGDLGVVHVDGDLPNAAIVKSASVGTAAVLPEPGPVARAEARQLRLPQCSCKLHHATGVLDDLRRLGPRDVVEEPAAAGVHQLAVALHLLAGARRSLARLRSSCAWRDCAGSDCGCARCDR